MPQLFKNNARATLGGSGLSSAVGADGTFSVATGKGALFPGIDPIVAGTYFDVTVQDATNIEIIRIKKRTSDVFTIDSRAREGTTASTFASGAIVALRITALAAESMLSHPSLTSNAHNASAVSNTPSGNLAATDVQGALNELQTDVDTRATSAALAAHAAAADPHPLYALDTDLSTGLATKQAAAAQLDTLAAITAQQATDLAALSTFMGTVLNDADQMAALITLGAPFNKVLSATVAATVTSGNRGHLLDCTDTFTLSLTAAATLGDGFAFAVRNSGTGVITIDPNAAELIDGAATVSLTAGESCIVVCNGTAWKTLGRIRGILQEVEAASSGALATGTTIVPFDDTVPQITEGDQYLSLGITPRASTSTLQVDVTVFASHSVAAWMTAAIFKDAIANSIGAASTYIDAATGGVTITFSRRYAASNTSPQTFSLRVGGSVAGTTTINGQNGARIFGGVMTTSMKVTEIAA